MTNVEQTPPPGMESPAFIPDDVIRYTIEIETVSELNRIGENKWITRDRARNQRAAAKIVTIKELDGWETGFPMMIKLIRISIHEMDGDNLQGALKHIRDGIADALKINDGDKRVTWTYDQRKPKEPDEFGVEVEIR